MTSSILGTYSTQSLLAAVGVAGGKGAVRNGMAAAGMNWVMKDGLGRYETQPSRSEFIYKFWCRSPFARSSARLTDYSIGWWPGDLLNPGAIIISRVRCVAT